MTIYASRTPRDLNHDPFPYQSIQSAEIGLDYRVNEASPIARPEQRQAYKLDPRPEFDHTQHNEPNPILVAFRAYSDKHGMDAEDRANLAGAWLQAPGYYERRLVEGRLSRQERDHARKVLTRLANLSQRREPDMTIKTPEQIADEFYDRYIEESANGGYPMWRQTIQDAIEADRSQRATALDALHEWAVNVSCFMAEDKSNDWSEELDALVEIEQTYELVDKDGEKK